MHILNTLGEASQILCTVKKKIKCSEDSEILHELVRDTAGKSVKNKLIHVVSRTISYGIIYFLTVGGGGYRRGEAGGGDERDYKLRDSSLVSQP